MPHFLTSPYRCRKCGLRFWAVASRTWLRIAALCFLAAASLVGFWIAQVYDPMAEKLDVNAKLEAARQRVGTDDYERAMRHLDAATPDPREALVWLQRAAQDGHTRAQYQLGIMLRDGVGIAADPERAFTWLRLAAEGGDAQAQFHLGAMYLDGTGTAPDPAKGYAWVSLAAARGIPKAAELRDVALLSMTPSEASEAKTQARRMLDNRLPAGAPVKF